MAKNEPFRPAPGELVILALIFVVAVVLPILYFRIWEPNDRWSFTLGQGVGILAWLVPFLLYRVYGFFVRHGWAYDVRDWLKRVKVEFHSDWHRSPHASWAIDWLMVRCGYNGLTGGAGIVLAFMGLNLSIGL